jgi:hypothetical protein
VLIESHVVVCAANCVFVLSVSGSVSVLTLLCKFRMEGRIHKAFYFSCRVIFWLVGKLQICVARIPDVINFCPCVSGMRC